MNTRLLFAPLLIDGLPGRRHFLCILRGSWGRGRGSEHVTEVVRHGRCQSVFDDGFRHGTSLAVTRERDRRRIGDVHVDVRGACKVVAGIV